MFNRRAIGPSLTISRKEPPPFQRAPVRPDEHAQTGRVEELELCEVDDQVVGALLGGLGKRRAHRWSGGQIETAAKLKEHRIAAFIRLEINAQLVMRHLRGLPFAPAPSFALPPARPGLGRNARRLRPNE